MPQEVRKNEDKRKNGYSYVLPCRRRIQQPTHPRIPDTTLVRALVGAATSTNGSQLLEQGAGIQADLAEVQRLISEIKSYVSGVLSGDNAEDPR